MLKPAPPPADDHSVLQHLRTLADAQLVVAVTAEAFAFRHALTREAVYATMLKRQRAALHALVAETLEANSADASVPGQAAALAYHYREAANWPKALEYAQRAGEQAQARYAPREAVEHFTRALEAATHVGQAPDLRLLRGRGQAFETLGEFEHARADYERGLGLARASGSAQAEWQALVDLGFAWAGYDYGKTGDYFKQALALARATGEPLSIAHSLNRVGNWLDNTGHALEGLQHHREALDIFQAQGSPAEMAATYDLLGLAFTLVGDIRKAQEQVEHAIALFRRTDDKRGLISSLAAHSGLISNCDTLPWTPQTLASCRAEAAEALDLARQIGWLAGQAEIRWLFGFILGAFGEFGEALRWAAAARHLAGEIEHREWTVAAECTLGQIYIQLLQPEMAARYLSSAQQVAAELRSGWWIAYTGAFMALAQLQFGQAQAARAELNQAAATLGLGGGWAAQPPRGLLERYLAWAWGEAALAAGQPAEALAVADQLIASAINPGGEPIMNLLKLKGEALLALDQAAEARAPLDLALQGAREHQARPVLWQVHRDRARLAERLGRPDEARRELEAARGVVEALASSLEEGTLMQGFLGRALGQIGGNG